MIKANKIVTVIPKKKPPPACKLYNMNRLGEKGIKIAISPMPKDPAITVLTSPNFLKKNPDNAVATLLKIINRLGKMVNAMASPPNLFALIGVSKSVPA